jgi:hypothetical protein
MLRGRECKWLQGGAVVYCVVSGLIDGAMVYNTTDSFSILRTDTVDGACELIGRGESRW